MKKLLKQSLQCFMGSGITLPYRHQRGLIYTLLKGKYAPLLLTRQQDDAQRFSDIVSHINVGGFYKTVSAQRHALGDALLDQIIRTAEQPLSFADIGCSDGSASLQLYQTYQSQFSSYDLYDKYTTLSYTTHQRGKTYTNHDNRMVYKHIGPLLLYVFPFGLSGRYSSDHLISFTNPAVSQAGLTITEFDVTSDFLPHSYDLIKCANILNLVYFPPEVILQSIHNCGSALQEQGYLVIIHNHPTYEQGEAVLIYQKIGNQLTVHTHQHDHELYPLLGPTIYLDAT